MRQFTALFVLLALLCAAAPVGAQVAARTKAMSRGSQEALVLDLPGSEPDEVQDLWEDWLKDTYKVKTAKTRKVRTGERSSLNFVLPGIGRGSKVDLYSLVDEAGQGSQLTVWIATPRGYVGPGLDGGEYVEAERMLMSFALEVSRDQLEREVDDQEEMLSDLEKELDRLRRDKERAEKEIEDARQRIAKLEGDIELNLVAQDEKQRQIEAQLLQVESAKRRLKDF